MSITEALQQAKDLIADPEHWTTDAFGRNVFGALCPSSSPLTVRWCAVGALLHDSPTSHDAIDALSLSAWDLYRAMATSVNDNLGHEAVMKMYDHAIEKSKEAA